MRPPPPAGLPTHSHRNANKTITTPLKHFRTDGHLNTCFPRGAVPRIGHSVQDVSGCSSHRAAFTCGPSRQEDQHPTDPPPASCMDRPHRSRLCGSEQSMWPLAAPQLPPGRCSIPPPRWYTRKSLILKAIGPHAGRPDESQASTNDPPSSARNTLPLSVSPSHPKNL